MSIATGWHAKVEGEQWMDADPLLRRVTYNGFAG